MATLGFPVNWSVISRLSKDLDFYYERGKLIVRTYPRRIRQPRTADQLTVWNRFLDGQALYKFMGQNDTRAFSFLSGSSEFRGRDFFMSKFLHHNSTSPGPWVAWRRLSENVLLNQVQIQTKSSVATAAKIRYSILTSANDIQPWKWTGFGHRIRNRTLYRRWRLSQRWEIEAAPSMIISADEFQFNIFIPANIRYLYYQFAVDPLLAPPGQSGFSGAFKISFP
jgi:hypothetical protein